MAAAPGTRFGVYEVLAPLGAGGMGEVYRARDTKLGRDVALKILPASFAADTDRIARFEREAKTLASLNHPCIAQVYGFEDGPAAAAGQHGCALVMELVDGEDLSHRLLRGRLSIENAIALARQLADALDAAHEAGIVHRDLKPANIKVREDGTIKVLDFGLAKPGAASAASAPDAVNSPTITSPATLTMQGVILGTAAYMSPEQAKGKPVDKRADIWAFGCVLYEMLTGRRAFEGEDVADTLARVLDREPDWTRLPGSVPDHVRAALQRCLTKDRRARMRDIADARHAIDAPGSTTRPSVPARTRAAAWLGWSIAGLMTSAVGALLWLRPEATDPRRPIIRTSIDLPAGHTLSPRDRSYPMAISHDGARIAFVGEVEGRSQLFVRELATVTATPLAGTAGARQPFFSPDGRWIAFFAGLTLQRVAVDGGAPIRIRDAPSRTAGGTWGADDTIVFATGEGLAKVQAGGGAPQRIDNTGMAAWPDLLPDGRTVLYSTGVQYPSEGFAVIDIDGDHKRMLARVTDAELDGPALLGTVEISQARFLATGHIVYGQSPGVVRRVAFDRASLAIAGSPASVADSIERGAGGGAVYFAASQTGLLIYAPTGERHQLVWVDRQGAETPISNDRAAFRIPHVSPNGRRIAVSINDEARRSDIWIYDAERGTRDRLTTENHNLESPWTPDGNEIWFSSAQGIEAVPVDNPGARRVEVQARGAYPTTWTADGNVLYHTSDRTSQNVMIAARGQAPRPLLNRPFNEWMPKVSRDGRWLAYSSDESGRFEIYVARLPDLAGRVTVSTDGGLHPVWARDGRELFYRAGDAVMAVAIDTSNGFRAERPRRLFSGAYTGTGQDASFDVALDGRRFVMIKSDDASTRRRITVVQNWNDAPAAR